MEIKGGVTAPKGFLAGALHCGIRKSEVKKKDLSVIMSKTSCKAAAVYTKNKVFGAPITVTRNNIADGTAQLMICNSGNANTCNADGVEIATKMCEMVAEKFNLKSTDIIVASTGVIGQPLDISKIEAGIKEIELVEGGSHLASEGIMTTDLVAKDCAVEFEIGGKTCVIGCIAKGSGMINPNMATMLGFVTTDVNISSEMLDKALKLSVDATYNMVSVDGDTSTNDMVSIMANGMAENAIIDAENEDFNTFVEQLTFVSSVMAKQIAKDGEGATKLIAVNVNNSQTVEDARILAKSVVNSSLVKTAMFGNDANWGRILCALGYAEADFDPLKVNVDFQSEGGNINVCTNGASVEFDEDLALKILNTKEVNINIDMNNGNCNATAYGCDLTYDYVKINGDYRT